MASKQKHLEEMLKQSKEDVPEEFQGEVEKLTKNLYEKEMLPKDAMGLSDDMVEGIYSYAYRMYNTGKYDKATQLFRLLIMLNPTDTKFLMGLAACFHMEDDYQTAATTYLLGSLIDPTNPVLHYHASDCYVQLDNTDMAIQTLEACIKRCNLDKKYTALKERAEASLGALKGKTKEAKEETKKEKKKAEEKPKE